MQKFLLFFQLVLILGVGSLQAQNLVRNGGCEQVDPEYTLPGRLTNADMSESILL